MNKDIEKQFIEWKDTVIDPKGNIPGDRQLIIRLFRYDPPVQKANIIGMDGESLSEERRAELFAIAKVIAVGTNTDFKVGDLCSVPDYLLQSQINPAYYQVMEALKERPAPEIKDIPSKYVLRIFNEWDKYVMILDKFTREITPHDKLTFCIPEVLIRKYEYLEQPEEKGTKGRAKHKEMESIPV